MRSFSNRFSLFCSCLAVLDVCVCLRVRGRLPPPTLTPASTLLGVLVTTLPFEDPRSRHTSASLTCRETPRPASRPMPRTGTLPSPPASGPSVYFLPRQSPTCDSPT